MDYDRQDARTAEARSARCRPAIRRSGTGKVGVLLVNLGTPDGTDFRSMWRYLREFLSDRASSNCRAPSGIRSSTASC